MTDDPYKLLQHLARTYDFGAKMNKRLADALKQPTGDPLSNVPWFLGKLSPPSDNDIHVLISFGSVDGHVAALVYNKSARRVRFVWGCRVMYTEADAREHWHGNVSVKSNRTRPHATALIDYAAAICKHRGWKWS